MGAGKSCDVCRISIHALLAESDLRVLDGSKSSIEISIHALLAESDNFKSQKRTGKVNFYPRSPCGERPVPRGRHIINTNFYPRSPCGERPCLWGLTGELSYISIHALLAESDPHLINCTSMGRPFLSTLSLRRATALSQSSAKSTPISIHALLAESDILGRVEVA